MQLTRKFIIGSLLVHLGLIIAACIFSLFDHTIKETVVVYGAHSRKPSHVRYKSSHVPFVGGKKQTKSKATKKQTKKKTKNKAKIKAKKAPKQKPKKRALKNKKLPPAKFHELKEEPVKKHKKKKRPEPIKEKAEEESLEEEVVEEKKEPEPEPELEPVVTPEETQPEAVTQEEVTQDPVTDDDANPDVAGGTGGESQEVIDINLAHLSDDPDAKLYQKLVQEEVDRHWKPPVGVAKDTVCTAVLHINNKGKVSQAEYVKKSNNIIYDLSIMRIEKQLAFHPKLWGKKIKVDFKQ